MTTRPRAVEYSLLPLKNVVVFPQTIVTLMVGREKSIRALEDAVAHDNRILVATQRNMDIEDPQAGDIFNVGTLAEILQLNKQPDGNVQVVVEGVRRMTVQRITQAKGFFRATSTELVEREAAGADHEPAVRQVKELFQRYAKLNRNVPSDAIDSLSRLDDLGRLSDILTAHIPVDIATKQSVLEVADHRERLDRVTAILSNEIEILEVEQKIRGRVRQQMDRNQREYYLKEQLKAIHEELGSDVQSEIADMRSRLEEKDMPEAVLQRVLREVDRLERMPQTSPESNVVRTYIDLILGLPWNERTEDRLDIDEAQRVLDDEHFGLDKVKERIIEFLAVRQLIARSSDNRSQKGPILCLVGPPGVGKTSLGRSIATAMNRKFIRLSLGGVRDEAEIRGHRRTYVGAMPGRIIQSMRTVGVKNPVIVLDEIDKMSNDFRGDPAAALLEVLDPEQNAAFSDHYLEVPYDLSEVMFITTANVRWNIPRPLLDRMEVIEIHGYTEDEKVQIAKRFLLPKQVREHGIGAGQIETGDKTLRQIVQFYTHEAGVRNLERSLATICRKAARKVIRNPEKKIKLTGPALEDYLGPKRFRHQGALEESQVGVAMGLAWTEHGGEMLPVEVVTMPGKGNLIITGRLGDVMQESARTAVSYIRSRADLLRIDRNFQEKLDLHIHLPEGAIPKDGPSAGITMATAIISALTKRPVRNDIAMTGEITLRGRVLPIGGLKEKTLAAHRAGIRQVIAPEDNTRDLPEIPKNIRGQMRYLWVSSVDQVLREVFDQAPADWVEAPAEDGQSAGAPDDQPGSAPFPDAAHPGESIPAAG